MALALFFVCRFDQILQALLSSDLRVMDKDSKNESHEGTCKVHFGRMEDLLSMPIMCSKIAAEKRVTLCPRSVLHY